MSKIIRKTKFNIDNSSKNIDKRTFDGIIFASEMEMKYYRDILLPLKKMGQILSIQIQPEYLLQPKFSKYGKNYQDVKYVGDFEVEYSDHKIVSIEVKGLATETAKLKRKLFDYAYPKKVLQWISFSGKYGGWIDYDELQKLRAKSKRKKKDDEI
jgi:hypothetical protein